MRRVIILFSIVSILFASCARGITPYEAANGKAKCKAYIK